eukprot:TRINITY_DN65820_c0_g1_i1.p1 TRINITY_DN65820_c0_g1~~TRINITY_DN65820_c0_g1_i1.p1  ORF type:complete len:102 (-),score=31.02 TRINITY_DN65820_c0_g1_i1:50-355(-)
MALVDGDGNKLTLGKIPTFHVRIRASRREIIWTSDRSQGGSDKQGQQEEDSQKEAETGNQQKSPAKSLPSLPIKKLTRKELIEQKGSKQGGLGFPLKESKV